MSWFPRTATTSHIQQLKTTEMFSLTVPEARTPKSECLWGLLPPPRL